MLLTCAHVHSNACCTQCVSYRICICRFSEPVLSNGGRKMSSKKLPQIHKSFNRRLETYVMWVKVCEPLSVPSKIDRILDFYLPAMLMCWCSFASAELQKLCSGTKRNMSSQVGSWWNPVHSPRPDLLCHESEAPHTPCQLILLQQHLYQVAGVLGGRKREIRSGEGCVYSWQ